MFDLNDKNISQDFRNLLQNLDNILIDCPDIVRRKVYLKDGKTGYFIYIDGLVDLDLVEREFVGPIVQMNADELSDGFSLLNLPIESVVPVGDINKIAENIMTPSTVFIADGISHSFSCPYRKFEKRSVTESEVEKNLRGAHEGFVEPLAVNLSILRRKVKNPDLKFRQFKVGNITKQTIIIGYIENLADKNLLDALSRKISSVNWDGPVGIGYIEQLIAEFPHSPFPQYVPTERPDKTVAALLEGRFVVLLDGTPVTLIAPVSFFSFFQAVDDFTSNWMFGTFFRIIRFLGVIIALFLPGLYIAIMTFHYYLIPLNLLIPLAVSRSQVAFPPFAEAIIMEIIIEMLREAAIRLPTYIGSTIGIVGGIIIGQAAVQAGIVSTVLIIVVAITAIASFLVPTYEMGLAVRLSRFLIMICAALFGMIGITIAAIFILAHLVSIESLGQPYFQPLSPIKIYGLKDTLIRMPLKYIRLRPGIAHPKYKRRGQNNG